MAMVEDTGTATLRPRSPLDGIACAGGAADAGVVIAERRLLARLALRGDGADPAFQAAVRQAAGLELPLAPNTVAGEGAGPPALLWLGPDEWLLVGAPGAEAELAAALRAALTGQHAAVIDLGDDHTVIRLSGAAARSVLAKGCPLDLHPRAFGPGRCARSHLARAAVILHQIDDRPAYDIHVRASFADYLWHWLADAGLEFGLRTEA